MFFERMITPDGSFTIGLEDHFHQLEGRTPNVCDICNQPPPSGMEINWWNAKIIDSQVSVCDICLDKYATAASKELRKDPQMPEDFHIITVKIS
jgi:hypothetical protein